MTKFGRMKAQPPAHAPQQPASKIRDIDADLNREWPGQRLTDRDRLAHLLLADPAAAVDQLALHLTDERDGSAKAEQTETKEVEYKLAHRAL